MSFGKEKGSTRIFFATDIHGSEICWRKFLNAGKHYEVDVLILGGDMTGKALVPLIDQGNGHWKASLLEVDHELNGADEVAEFEDSVRRRGYYPFRTTPDELESLRSSPTDRNALFHREMLGTVARWMDLADERLANGRIACFVCPGNDDQFEVDEIIADATRVELAEGRVVEVGSCQMASTGWTNRTPWETYREEDEPELAQRIENVVSSVTAPAERTIFGFHCPPFRSGLDDAPEITADMRPRFAGRSSMPVGSTAVRESIEQHQPALSLHGHIHESKGTTRIGRTLSVNPGSSYEQGQLLGALVELDGGKRVKRFMLTAG